MPFFRSAILVALMLCLPQRESFASSLAKTTEAEDVKSADGVCRGRVVSLEAFRHPVRGGIFTRARIVVLEALKGAFPSEITIIQRGGMLDGWGEANGLSAPLAVDDERLFFLSKRADGTLEILRGFAGAPRSTGALARMRRLRLITNTGVMGVPQLITGEDFGNVTGTQQANSGTPGGVTGLLVDGNGIPARFLAPDRGEPVPYLVDAAALPAGITLAQALTAVQQALAAWGAVTGISFRYDGLASFGMSAADVTASDERLWIQLHDSFGEIPAGSTLGIGGRSFTNVSSNFAATGGGGGQVDGAEFHKTTRGYVVLKDTSASMQNLATFTEVLCHEIGHALGMAHSSNNAAEPDTTLKQAMMYYQAHADGRGAALGSYDGPVIQQAHPPANTPPFSYDRIVPLVSAPGAITTVAGINEIVLFGCDLQTASASLPLVTSGPSSGGAATITFTGSTMKLIQTGYFGDASVDPASSSFYLLKWVRFSDGVNCSPWTRVRVTSIHEDTQPTAVRDGLPDSWMTAHFGSITPVAANLSRAGDDKDADGLTNLMEFRLGTSPLDSSSRLRVTGLDAANIQWLSAPYQLYVVESSSDLQSWTRFGNPVLPVTTTGAATGSLLPGGGANAFYRVQYAP